MNWLPSRLWAKMNLVSRLSLVVALSMIVGAIGAAYQSTKYVVHKTQNEITTEYNRQIDMLEFVVVSTVFFDIKPGGNFDEALLAAVLTNFKYGPDVTQVSFRDTANVATFSKDFNLQLEAPLFFSRLCGLEKLKFNKPITVNGTYFGLLILSMSPNRIINQAWEQYQYLVQVMFISLAVILFLVWIVLRKALYPLLSLADAGKSLIRGDLSVRVEVTGSPELQTVLLSFNQMASSIQDTLSALQESEEIFRNMFYNSSTGKSITYIDGSVRVNPAFCEMLGYSMEELAHENWQNLSHPDDYQLTQENLRQLHLGQKESARFIKRYFKKDGSIVWADVNTVLQKDNEGKPQYYITGVIDITERKDSEEKLNYQSNLLASVQDAVIGTDMNYTIQHWSVAAQSLYGWTAEEVLGHPLRNFIRNEYFPGTNLNDVLHAITEKGFWLGELKQNHHDGTMIPILASVSIVKDVNGNPIGFVSVNRDITERKQAESALVLANEQLALAQHSAGAGIWDWDMPTGKLKWAPELFELFGLDPTITEATFEVWRNVMHPEDRQSAEDRIYESIRNHTPLFNEYRVLLPSGEVRWINALGNTLYDEQREAQRMTGICLDVTERKQAEVELRESEEKFSAMFRSSPVPISIYAMDGHIIEANAAYFNLTGYSREETIGSSSIDQNLLSPESRQRVIAEMGKNNGYLRGFEIDIRARDGSTRTVLLSGEQISIRGIPHRLGINVDITERKQAEEALKAYSEQLEVMVEERTRELQDAQEQLVRKEKLAVIGQLAGGVAHELRNPLGAIKNAIYFLNMVIEDPDVEIMEMLAVLGKEIGTAEKIASSLLDFARTRPPIRHIVSINDIIEELLVNTRLKDTPRVKVVLQLAGDLPPILADPDQLIQVFGNIILNGIQAMKGDGYLTVMTALESSKWVTVSITDNGEGITEENLKKLFEPLFTTKAQGIGLGLAVSKTLVKGHGGTIEVESRTGEGSTFTIRLPLNSDTATEG